MTLWYKVSWTLSLLPIWNKLNIEFFRQEVLAEDELEEESDSEDRLSTPIGRKVSHDRMSGGNASRKMSDLDSMMPSRKTSASSSTCPSRKWSRHSSPTRGEILRMDDEVIWFLFVEYINYINFII